MNIWIFNHYAQGPELPGGTRHYDLAQELLKKGHTISIFAAGFHYTLLEETVIYNNGFLLENKNGVQFIWVKTYPYQKNNFKRMLNILSYAWKLNFLIPKLGLKKPDIIIGSTVHPFAPIIASKFAKKYKVPFIYEIRDLWPQTFIDMKIWKENDFKAIFFKWIEKKSVISADAIIALSPLTAKYIEHTYNFSNVHYISNGINIDNFDTQIKQYKNIRTNATINRLQFLHKSKKILVLFSGAIVQSNNIGLIFQAAKSLKNKEIHIVLVGKGQEREKYNEIINVNKLTNIEFCDPVDKALVPVVLNLADILILIQANVQWGSSNKLFDYLASEKPILSSLHVEHNDLISQANCGYSVVADDITKFVEKLEYLAQISNDERIELGKNGRIYIKSKYNIPILANTLENLIQSLGK